ncbi:hypothetical protein XAPC_1937 [Xanthomonas citri pv. punicae str. LMG 859]|nr:hypothetical protein XAPC_1937 [Xanthomonas citri pv. punicae str. LMG 859]
MLLHTDIERKQVGCHMALCGCKPPAQTSTIAGTHTTEPHSSLHTSTGTAALRLQCAK